MMTENVHRRPLQRPAEEDVETASSEIKERWKKCNVLDTGNTPTARCPTCNQLWNMLELAEVITTGALLRDESRGAHYKPDFSLPEPKTQGPDARIRVDGAVEAAPREVGEDDDREATRRSGPKISYEAIATPVLEPEPRWYA